MRNIYLCVTQDHAWPVLLLAAMVCAASAFAGIVMLERARRRGGGAALAWLAAGGVVLGGGVWVTHFVAMLGYDAGVPLSFDAALTLLSSAIIVTAAVCAFALLHRARSAIPVLAGGLVLGGGIAVMHYVGMAGMRMPAEIVWNARYVAASALLSLGLSVLFALAWAQIRPAQGRIAASGLLAVLATVSLHFTGMAALDIVPLNIPADAASGLSAETMAALIGAGALLLVTLGLAAAATDAVLAARSAAEAVRLRALVEQLRESQQRLQAANAAKSQFLSRMSHEFRTPLNGIVGMATILRGAAADEQARMLDTIIGCGTALGQMVEQILDLNRFQDGDFALSESDFEIGEMLAAIEAAHRPRAEQKGLALTVAPLSAPLPVRGDSGRVAQIVSSLVSNAVKFTSKGGVRVSAHVHDAAHGALRLCVLVEDTGIGVPEDLAEAIFEPFAQADGAITRREDGAGLGLPLARLLCEAMGGSLTLERGAHGGSRFRAQMDLLDLAAAGRTQAA